MEPFYYACAEILQKCLSKEHSIRNLVYSSTCQDKKKLLKMCSETLKLKKFFDELLKLDFVKAAARKPAFRRNTSLFMVMLYEMLEGNGYKAIPKKYRTELDSIKTALMITLAEMDKEGTGLKNYKSQTEKVGVIPRYARVNTIKATLEEIQVEFEKNGYVFEALEEGIEPKEFCSKIESMDKKQVFIDCHVKNLLIFAPTSRINGLPEVKNKKLILQDKASCLASELLAPPSGAKVIDVCAAPGMKTTHLLALMGNKGRVYAFDRDKTRFEDLKTNMIASGSECGTIFNQDFLKVEVEKMPYDEVEYALVDPPCSGSGMIKRLDSFIDDEQKDDKRLAGLGNLQAMLLKHAMKLPKLKKVVYSTCSIHEAENERVIEEVLKDEDIATQFKLVNALPSWKHRGLDSYDFGDKCLRCDPQTDKTNGFFVAIFERI